MGNHDILELRQASSSDRKRLVVVRRVVQTSNQHLAVELLLEMINNDIVGATHHLGERRLVLGIMGLKAPLPTLDAYSPFMMASINVHARPSKRGRGIL